MGQKYLMAVDAGTGSVRAVLFDTEGNQIGVSQQEWFHREDPRWPGSMDFDWVHNWELASGCIRGVIAKTGIDPADIAAVSTTCMREGIVLYDEHWKKGVIGIVASRLTEIYFRPCVVLTRDGDLATGSARSVMGFDIYSAIKSCRDLLLNFGGHTYAAGLTLRWADVPEFRRRFQHYVEEHIQPEQTEAVLRIDAEIDFKDITKRLHNDLKRFAPFGPGNEKPMFCTIGVYDYGTSKVVGRTQEHIKLELVDSKSGTVVNGIAFGQSASARYIKSKRSFDIAYTIEDNIFKHNLVQLQIEDIRPTEGEITE